ncbi:MAG: hypothetical protein HC812_15910 [Leptolyngbya sp. RL_3_1]|nr:hypothetical protein [Leptolyngbya sp. RL_3_1]
MELNVPQPPLRPTRPAPAAAPIEEQGPPPAAEPVAAFQPPQPISPPSEPRQYRAIGLVRGRYKPQEEQFNRGDVITDEGAVIDAVLLGRVTSLIKNYIDLETPHLWVVYPRTRQDEETKALDLHLQIVGVWEPETLGLPGEDPQAKAEAPEEEVPPAPAGGDADLAEDTSATTRTTTVSNENYFSIRGEILSYDDDTQMMVVKILQTNKQDTKGIKAFRLTVVGQLTGKTVGYFWELDVERRDKQLVMLNGHAIGIVPPKKKKKRTGGPRSSAAPHRNPGAPKLNKSKPRIRPTAPVKSNPL